jgi:hypothetical protein
MQRLAKAFLSIALWRSTPAHLPASLFLLTLTAIAAGMMEVLGALLTPGSPQELLVHIALEIVLPLAFTWAVLAAARHRERFLQTATALFGVDVLAALVLYPLGAMYHAVGDDRFASIPLGILLLAVFLWYLLAGAHIWRSALDTGFLLGGIISVGFFVLSLAIEQQLLPQT